MNLVSKKVVKNLLYQQNLQPSKKMGQNFLVKREVLDKIIGAAELKPTDVVLEIGPGIGTLTRELAKRVNNVIAVEKDLEMIGILKETLKDLQNIEIVQGDILKIKNLKLKIKNYKLISNLPYNIATEVIRRFLETENPPKLMVLMVQKEVGERICSKPPKMERLGVLVQGLADVKIIETVRKKCFWPKPKVDSVILKIVPNQTSINTSTQLCQFVKIVKAGFSHPRKQLINNFSKELNLSREKVKKWLKESKIQPNQRAETLGVEDWIKLAKTFR
ncbi:ribosomal RNA small subunit methyltransferase A [bacterium]|nr:ribosomal RNA small subunit methyltransferase A [bacterium]